MSDRSHQLAGEVSLLRDDLRRDEAQHDLLKNLISTKAIEIQQLEADSVNAQQARALLESLTEKKREVVRTKIEDLITYGVQAVFGPTYSFRIEQTLKRNQVAFEYKILHEWENDVKTSDLRGFHGGGLVALVGFLLRVVMVLFTHPPRRRLILLDETMAALDGDKRAPFAQLLNELGHKLGMQFMLITHSPEYAEDADVVYEVRQNAGHGSLHRI